MEDIQRLIMNLKTLRGPFPSFDTNTVPESPNELFIDWFRYAIKMNVHEPNAFTLSTVDEQGNPDARVLILKNVNENGWYFASSSESKKGQQLQKNAAVSLTFYWSSLGRQVRISGISIDTGKEASSKDFLGRGRTARATALIGKQSTVLTDQSTFEKELNHKKMLIEVNPDLVYQNWILYLVKATKVEFWQGDRERRHIRLNYRLENNHWTHELLWP